jgi:hypothetical protein
MTHDDMAQQLREAIIADGRSHYAIAKAAGVDPDVLDRFARGKDLYFSTACKILAAIGMELRPAKRGRRRAIA